MGDPAPGLHTSGEIPPPPRCAACGEVMTQVGADYQCFRCSSPQIPTPDAPTRKAPVPVCPICGIEMTLMRMGEKLDFHCLRCTTARDTRPTSAPAAPAGSAAAPTCSTCKAPMTAIETAAGVKYECLKCTTFKDVRTAGTKRRARTESAMPEEVRLAGENPANLFGDYIFVREIGKGGMGVVHKAWDSKLGRWVALKLLKGDDPTDLDRFIREARTSAGLVHQNIVAVYEAGEFDGKHFISMQLVDGESLNRLRLSEKEAVQAIHQASLAVHFANERGVIHRDLKPHNIMMGKDKHVFVMDFGLARSAQASGQHVTLAGTILGTPAFMSPEQALCKENLDGRADVYGLGASLYHLLTGAAPFDAPSLGELLGKVVYTQPDSPRKANKKVNRDLETIVLKCLEKDPKSRYESGAELAEDLDRYLNGEPIKARPLMPGVRLIRKLRRHPVAVSIATAMLLALIITGVALIQWRRQAEEDRLRAQQSDMNALVAKKGADIKTAKAEREKEEFKARRGKAETAFTPARNNTLPEIRRALLEGRRDDVPALIKEVESYQAAAEAIDPTFKDGWVNLARVYRLMGNRAAAEEALKTAKDDPDAALEKGMLLAYEYGAERQVAEQKWNERERDLIRQGKLKEARPSTADDLIVIHAPLKNLKEKTTRQLALASQGLRGKKSDDTIKCGLARLDFFDNKIDEALKRLEDNNEADAFLIRGEIEESQGHVDQAKAMYEQVLERFKALEEPHLALGRLLRNQVEHDWWTDPKPAIEKALAHWTTRPPWVSGQKRARAGIYRLQGDYLWDQKRESPKDSYVRALKELGEGPEDREEHGRIAFGSARHAKGSGGDPKAHFEQARADFEAAGLHELIGEVWLNQATWEASCGADPQKSCAAAIAEFKQCPASSALVLEAQAHTVAGRWLLEHGQIPTPEYDAAIGILDGALKIQPDDTDALQQLGELHLRRGEWADSRAENPSPEYESAWTCFDRALQARAKDAGLHADRADAWAGRAAWKVAHGIDPAGDIDEAIKAFETSLGIAPGDAERLAALGEARAIKADWSAFNGVDPTALYEAAVKDFESALVIDSKLARAHGDLGRAEERIGAWQAAHGVDPTAAWKRAEESFTAAVGINANEARTFLLQGVAQRRSADLKSQRFEDSAELYGRALGNLREAFKINANLAQARAEESAALLGLAAWRADHGSDPTDDLKRARDLLKDAPPGPDVLYRSGLAAQRLAAWKSSRGLDPTADLDDALDRYTKANEATSKKDARIWSAIGNVHLLRGAWQASGGVDPSSCFDSAESALQQAVSFKGWDVASAHRDLGLVHDGRARRQESRGIDPLDEHDVAAREFKAALQANGFMIDVETLRGVTQLAKARWLTRHGKDAGTDAEVGAGKVNTADPAALRLSSRATIARGEGEGAVGRDPSTTYDRAAKEVEASLAIDGENPEAFFLRALARLRRAEFNARFGREVAPDLSAAEAAFGEAMKRHARFAEACRELGRVHFVRGALKFSFGQDPTADIEEAKLCFEAAVAHNPGYAEALAARAEALELQARRLLFTGESPEAPLAEALKAVDASLAINADDPRTHAIRGMVFDRRTAWKKNDEDTQRAIESYGKATAGNPRDARSWTQLGLTFLRIKERIKEAGPCFAKATAINATDPETHHLQGIASLYTAVLEAEAHRDPAKPLEAAAESFQRAVDADAKMAEAWEGLGDVHLYGGEWGLPKSSVPADEFSKAIQNYTEALKVNPRHVAALLKRGDAHLARDEAKEALEDFDAARAINPKCPAGRKRAMGLEKMGKYAEAVEAMEAETRARPEDADAWRELGVIYFDWADSETDAGKSMDRHAKAIAALDKAAGLDASDAKIFDYRGGARQSRGTWLIQQQKWAGAEAELHKAADDFAAALKIDSTYTQSLGSIVWTKLLIGQAVGKQKGDASAWYKQALEDADRATEADGRNEEFHYLRGMCLKNLKRNKEAAEEFRRAPTHDGAKKELQGLDD